MRKDRKHTMVELAKAKTNAAIYNLRMALHHLNARDFPEALEDLRVAKKLLKEAELYVVSVVEMERLPRQPPKAEPISW